MKKNIFLLVCSFMCSWSQAQIALAKDDGTPIADGEVFTYNSTDEDVATLHYKIKNTSASSVKVRIKIMSIQNAAGSGFQFCYLSTCLPSVAANAVYPSNTSLPINIAANSETPSTGYNMWNSNAGSGAYPIDYVIKYYLVNNLNTEYGTPVTITYRYDPNATLTVDEVKKNKNSFANIPETLINSSLRIVSEENGSYSLYNTEGRFLLTGSLKKGNEEINVSNLNAGIYTIILKNSQGKTIVRKIIKK
ncbi:T9SS type A sorting domain-containing protein [Chryseobacterium sp. MEBOG06]|uniref:T9SS type A sorting domain-containing protein n=1 Tax=Chryseobacterium sp. MEBOG06 TaxID=2879938 RepID=UPI001F3E079E|nr:T9SS type A sorting domain-containing protein [Chryseobacterium sp. MEBOG06]UKB85657.1 T9SS type A sorting domain-containing protein [Chryseobacterium sp. MEBOG06]